MLLLSATDVLAPWFGEMYPMRFFSSIANDTLWTGVPGDYTNPDAPSVLSNVRKLVDEGHYAEATAAAFGLSDHPPEAYQPLGNINLEFDDSHLNYTSYVRELDLSTATVKVKYNLGDVEFTREHFSSNPHQVVVTKISSTKAASISFIVYLDSKLHHQSVANSANQIVMEGNCPVKRRPPKIKLSENSNGVRFAAVLDVQIGGSNAMVQVMEDRKLKIDGADWAILILAASSSFEGPFINPSESKIDPRSESIKTANSITNLSFSQLLAYHLDDYLNLFHRVSLQLSNASDNIKKTKLKLLKDDALLSTAERVKSFKIDEDPSLVELLFHYGRYLLISSSRPGTQVSNLQGIWNKELEPPWDAAPHFNINLQMNYWPSLSCNLSECQQPLFDFIASLAINGAKTAKVNYETSGWVAHQVSDIWAKTSPDLGDPVWAVWPMGGAWLCTHLWEHYTFSLDKEFLENTAYPLLEGCAAFLLDWLIKGSDGYLETNPSTSPEHRFVAPDGKTASVSYSSTMDISIIREVFNAVLSSAEILGKSDVDLVKRIKTALPKLPPTRISRDGSIMEWAQDFEDPEVHHRHVSHLFGLFPGHTITVEKTPDLSKAAANSLYKRGDIGPGWSTTWKMALWSHLRDSSHAYVLIKQMINLVDPDHEADFEGGLYSNLFTAHPPFQIDANFGFSAAIAEMLVQSTQEDLYILPALPRDKWPRGFVRGVKARGGVTLNISWKEGQLHRASLCSKAQSSLTRLHYNGKVAAVRFSCRKIYIFNQHLKCLKTTSIIEGTFL
ncbi:alpha-L-fucosidase 2 isoform X2 [Phalaenopsis equestris]|uniref:alpha-L-fucosidase 2 isoform X2 n=1 Tax=Phalaenopsis equestris TaxID=78828 RepID=UPI0009E1CA9A|nr:alpha-L-fucosidase 2 isoform X2 [Phalaenopsis equestris]